MIEQPSKSDRYLVCCCLTTLPQKHETLRLMKEVPSSEHTYPSVSDYGSVLILAETRRVYVNCSNCNCSELPSKVEAVHPR
jgi:hypothetical protein